MFEKIISIYHSYFYVSNNSCFVTSIYSIINEICLGDTFIFNKSVRENITLSTQTDLTRLERVIKDALLDDFINKLSAGMETILGDERL